MMTIQQSFSAVTNAIATVNDPWPAVILSADFVLILQKHWVKASWQNVSNRDIRTSSMDVNVHVHFTWFFSLTVGNCL